MDYLQVIIWAHWVYIGINRYKKSSDKYLRPYDPKEEPNPKYPDKNNLHGDAMSKFLRTSGFKWIYPKEILG